MNIILTEFGVPIYLCREIACHAPGSTEVYVSRTAVERKARTAALVADCVDGPLDKKRQKKRKKKKKKKKSRKRKLSYDFSHIQPIHSTKQVVPTPSKLHQKFLETLYSTRKRQKTH